MHCMDTWSDWACPLLDSLMVCVGAAAVTRPCLLQPPVLARSGKTLAFVLEWDVHTAGGLRYIRRLRQVACFPAVKSMKTVGLLVEQLHHTAVRIACPDKDIGKRQELLI